MACKCIGMMNEALKEHNTEVGVNWVLKEQGILTTVSIVTSLIEKRRGEKPKRIIPTYCPFCGVPYEPLADAPEGETPRT